jgi:acetyl esterase/lipase
MKAIVFFLSAMLVSSTAFCTEVQSDIEYGKADDESLLLDACVPDGAGPFPIAIIVHGGGWSGGDKARDMSLLFKPLTDAHFIWFSINYRLAPKHRFPACIDDVEQAVRWVKKHAAEYKGDPQRIALIGESAGGHLVCLAAARAKDDTRVAAVVGFAAPTDLVADVERRGGISPSLKKVFGRDDLDDDARNELKDASPLNFLKSGMPPFLLIHGTEDKSVLYSQSVIFQKRLKELGVPCEIITIEKGVHGMKNWEKLDTNYKEKMIAWLERTLGAEKH